MKENFEKSLEKVLVYEGGYSNVANDSGGATNLGITLQTLKQFYSETGYGDLDHDGDVDINDIKLLDTQEEVSRIYKKDYWDKMKLDDFPGGIDFLMFDFGVNSGPGNATKLLQKSLKYQDFDILVDGKLGSFTISAVKKSNINILIKSMIKERTNFYLKIVENKPSQKVFLQGWLNRLLKVSKEVYEFV